MKQRDPALFREYVEGYGVFVPPTVCADADDPATPQGTSRPMPLTDTMLSWMDLRDQRHQETTNDKSSDQDEPKHSLTAEDYGWTRVDAAREIGKVIMNKEQSACIPTPITVDEHQMETDERLAAAECASIRAQSILNAQKQRPVTTTVAVQQTDGDLGCVSRAERLDEYLRLMYERFLSGQDAPFFDYSTVDDDASNDDLEAMRRDDEDAYFDSEAPSTMSADRSGDGSNALGPDEYDY